MFSLKVIKDCPHTRAGMGVVHMTHPIISAIAGAVQDNIEWLVMLTGKRSDDGLTVHVTGTKVPLQYRCSALCGLVDEAPIDPEVVGVLHSHHSMMARFSTTDDTTFNTRFPLSIVVSQLGYFAKAEASMLLGFDYSAEGRAYLPCGALGVVKYTLLPDPMVADWPIKAEASLQGVNGPLGDCPHYKDTQEGLSVHRTASCGLKHDGPATHYFGADGKELLTAIRKHTRADARTKFQVTDYRPYYSKGEHFQGRRDEDFVRGPEGGLRSWNYDQWMDG